MADLYKLETSVPAAFAAACGDTGKIEAVVRCATRDLFLTERLLVRTLPGVAALFEGLSGNVDDSLDSLWGTDGALPAALRDPI